MQTLGASAPEGSPKRREADLLQRTGVSEASTSCLPEAGQITAPMHAGKEPPRPALNTVGAPRGETQECIKNE